MHLKNVVIINYKSCQNLQINLFRDQPNTLIGTNDAGKSAILKGIEILFGQGNYNCIKEGQVTSDLSNTTITQEEFKKIFEALGLPLFEFDSKSTYFLGELVYDDTELNEDIDNIASNHLKWVYENSVSQSIFILRVFNKDNPNGLLFLCTKDTEENLQLWNSTATSINAIVRDLKISPNELTNDNNKGRFSNLEKIRAVYNKSQTNFYWREYKDFLKKDKQFFPTFRYIDWKTTLKDLQALAGDAMSNKINEFKLKLSSYATTLSNEATTAVNTELDTMTLDLKEDLKNIKAIKANVFFKIEESITDMMIQKYSGDGDINIENQGDGVKKQIWFAFIKWSSLQGIQENDYNKKFIWCFDEPEVHLFPAAQRELYEIIKKLSSGVHQVIVSTHSTVYVDRLKLETIKQIYIKDGYSQINSCNAISDVHRSLGVRNSDFLFYNRFIAVEGPTEEVLIPHYYELYFNRSMQEDSIQLISMHSKDKLNSHKSIFDKLLEDFGKNNNLVYYILDKDSKINQPNVHLIGLFDHEDAISNSIWIAGIKTHCGIDISEQELIELRQNLNERSENKFYVLLECLIKTKLDLNQGHKYLPSKGRRSGEMLKEVIVSREHIPVDVIKIFQKLEQELI